jgi:cbb3-type cytochrome oxidase subunit 3
MKPLYKKISLLFLTIFLLLSFSSSVLASNSFDFAADSGLKSTADKTGHTKQTFFNNANSLEGGVANIIFALLSLVGMIFLILLIYGGVFWMTARGNETQAQKAKNIITNSVVGLAVVLLAYAISIFIIGSLT